MTVASLPAKVECCKISIERDFLRVVFDECNILDLSFCDNLMIFELKKVEFKKIIWNYENKITFLRTSDRSDIVSDNGIEIPVMCHIFTYCRFVVDSFRPQEVIQCINEKCIELIKIKIKNKTIIESFFDLILKLKYKNNNKLLNQRMNLYKNEWNNKYGLIKWLVDFPYRNLLRLDLIEEIFWNE